jgi:hypothetical protein
MFVSNGVKIELLTYYYYSTILDSLQDPLPLTCLKGLIKPDPLLYREFLRASR